MEDVDQKYSKKPKTKTPPSTALQIKFGIASALLLTLIFLVGSKNTVDQADATSSQGTKIAAPIITQGTVDGIDYYHCKPLVLGEDDSTIPVKHLVLLHGAAFTKENWKRKGILDIFCRTPGLSVSAMDLPVQADYAKLQSLLKAMKSEKLIEMPVVLVTPSASGKSMITWMQQSSTVIKTVPDFIQLWIPVASNGLLSVEEAQLGTFYETLRVSNNFQVLAIYGDQDQSGKRSSLLLEKHMSAKVVELPGGHPVYLDVPKQFCDTVLDFMGLKQK
jgi:hypothetical protein